MLLFVIVLLLVIVLVLVIADRKYESIHQNSLLDWNGSPTR